MSVLTPDFAQRWERRTAGPLTALALLFIAVYAAPILQPDLPPTWRLVCEIANIVIGCSSASTIWCGW